jgi:hypothetical protein
MERAGDIFLENKKTQFLNFNKKYRDWHKFQLWNWN